MGKPLWKPEEDAVLRKYAGVKPASEIAIIIGKPKNGVHHRIKKLKLNGRMTGDAHWNAKLSDLQAGITGALYDAGYTANEIHKVLTTTVDISFDQVCNICACRSRIAK